jgi:uncharacterized protein (DUF1501 family)
MPRTYSRRQFLQGCSAAIASLAGARLSNLSFSAQGNSADTLLVVFLRGGWDSLSVVPPVDGDDRGLYEKARPSLEVPSGSLLRLNDQFGLHPALSPLYDLYQQGHLAVVHAAGLNYDTRSHFDAMEYMELGTPGLKGTTSGWIARHLSVTGSAGLMPTISTSSQPTSLLNFTPNVNMYSPSDLSQWDNGLVAQQQEALRKMYAGDSLLEQVGRRTLEALEVVSPLVDQEYFPSNGAVYNDDDFSRQLITVAQMIKLEAGLQVATVDFGGWDTHEYQNDGVDGYLAGLLGALGDGLASFFLDLDSGYTRRLSVVVMSEFGRRLVQNESHGTDHGHGSVMLALGGAVNGGQVFGPWPGLENDQLYDHADLAVTTDYRQILGELLSTRLGNPNIESVFPGFGASYNPMGLFRA